jgi:hypothetical protein
MGTMELEKWTGPTRAAKAEQNLLYRHDKPNEGNKKVPILSVLCESPFTAISTVSRSHPSLVSLAGTHRAKRLYSIKEVEMRKVNRQTENPILSYMALFLHQLLDAGGGGMFYPNKKTRPKNLRLLTVHLKWNVERRPVLFSS